MLAFTVRRKAQVFHHHEIFRIGFQHPGALRPAMQPGQIRHIHAVIPDQQGDRFAGDALAAPSETELLGGGGLHVDVIHMALQIFRQEDAHLRDVRRHFRRLSDDGDIEVAEAVSLARMRFQASRSARGCRRL